MTHRISHADRNEPVHNTRRGPRSGRAQHAGPPSLVAQPSKKLVVAVLFAFLMEGILSKAIVGGRIMPIWMHMGATAVLFAIIGFLGMHATVPANIHSRLQRRFASLYLIVFVLAFWGLVASIASEQALLNTAFWSLWAANFVVIWWAVPRIAWFMTANERARLISAVVAIVIVGSLVLHRMDGPDDQGRLRGMFVNSTYAGYLLAFGGVWLSLLLMQGKLPKWHSRWAIALLVLATGMLVYTGTRKAIFGAFFASAAAILFTTPALALWQRRRVINAAGLVACGLIICGMLFLLRADVRESMAQRTRVAGWNDPIADVWSQRAKFWEQGLREFWTHAFVGKGFLSKWGHVEYKGGLTMPRVAYLFDDDPHSAVLTIAQQIGVPGATLFALYLAGLVACVLKSSRLFRLEVTALTILALLWAGLGNQLISFGNPVDRLFWVALVMLLSSTSSDQGSSRYSNSRRSNVAHTEK